MTQWSRRDVLVGLGGASLANPGWLRTAAADPLGLPVGIQLWTVKTSLQTDPERTLGALRQIGFGTVETAGFGKATAAQFRAMLGRAGLSCPSAHLDFMKGDTDAVLADANALGVHYAVSSILRLGTGTAPAQGAPLPVGLAALLPMTLDDARKTAALANRIGDKARRAGLQYVYHNHFFEFVDQGGGAIAYDILLQETDPSLVQFEIDCGWMAVAGYDPVQFFKRHPARFPLIHVKDFEAPPDQHTLSPALRQGAALGRGVIDYKPIFAAATAANLKFYFAEQEAPFVGMTELEAAKISFDYLHSLR